MQLSLITLASLASVTIASASVEERDFWPAHIPLAKRAVSGAEYQCHANCGYTILNAQQSGYCDNSQWKTYYQGCMECAYTYNLWPDYGDGVTTAAKACGLTVSPSPSSGSSQASSTASAQSSAAQTSAAQTSAAQTSATQSTVRSSAAQSSSLAASASSAAASSSGSVSVTKATTPAASATTLVSTTPSLTHGSNSTTSSTSVPTAGATKNLGSFMVAGAAVLVAVNMM
ncbi:hypothetical protein V2G26_005028 [Clonostachys chloroleuca]|uniref:Uncharacterized protein n=1 Tax=Clonostachys chloroleuca TaxID=1926264 RepID=A0AA35Q5R4_9HYPO|nr:unnamed protein product [Clonostachys chloroleuca]